ncbi:MAG: hemerythrin domain-containing protein [Flavobacteriales bacterium]|nr:hemerythrin domain-containing protein [Flavobacteriales bacterium]
MNKPLYDFFAQDHRRLEQLLEEATNKDVVDMVLYNEFRSGLLTHIKMEEKVLFLAAQEANGGEPLPLASVLRVQHGAITALMVPPPDKALIKVLWHVLEVHDTLEEESGGMYDICEQLTAERTTALLDILKQTPLVPINPINPAPIGLEAAKRALARAGFDYEQIAAS